MRFALAAICSFIFSVVYAQDDVSITNVDSGWANNSVNAVVFRKNSLVTFRDTQYIAFYDKNKFVVIGKRRYGTDAWQIKKTPYSGNATDAHNCISIMVDGEGYLHIAWDHHNNALHYCRSISPGSLELTEEMPMTGKFEQRVTYPEFYKMPNGNLLFFYRNGESGSGNLVIKSYDVRQKQWAQLQDKLVDGEGLRNAYWQACVDAKGVIHISWVWRESPDVASNHDMCYARSSDGGKTWERSNGEKYRLPITAATAEYAAKIPQGSELINQTSMCTDENENIYIATYFMDKDNTVPQYHIIYNHGGIWKTQAPAFCRTAFSLSGVGTKHIPIARPQIISWQTNKKQNAALIFRDEERGNKVSAVICNDLNRMSWRIVDFSYEDVGSWEPSYDTELWEQKKVLNLFVEKVAQEDEEGEANFPPQMVQVLEWKP